MTSSPTAGLPTNRDTGPDEPRHPTPELCAKETHQHRSPAAHMLRRTAPTSRPSGRSAVGPTARPLTPTPQFGVPQLPGDQPKPRTRGALDRPRPFRDDLRRSPNGCAASSCPGSGGRNVGASGDHDVARAGTRPSAVSAACRPTRASHVVDPYSGSCSAHERSEQFDRCTGRAGSQTGPGGRGYPPSALCASGRAQDVVTRVAALAVHVRARLQDSAIGRSGSSAPGPLDPQPRETHQRSVRLGPRAPRPGRGWPCPGHPYFGMSGWVPHRNEVA